MLVRKCQKRLALVWFCGVGVLFILVMLQSVFGRYTGQTEKAWAWFLPTMMPTFSLILGVLVAESFCKSRAKNTVDSFLYRVALGLSVCYFFVVFLTIALQPLAPISPLALLEMSNLWLAPLQGIVSAVLGAFFVKTSPGE